MTPTGLSPRARGNLRGRRSRGVPERSIPASAGEPGRAAAGEPRSPSSASPIARVYPRERGGTRDKLARGWYCVGLSPRARGNHVGTRRVGRVSGSIPASAGEPVGTPGRSSRTRVYPRERGGTRVRRSQEICRPGLSPRARGNPLLSLSLIAAGAGLSPRARGNHARRRRGGSRNGSIPASAGEPPRPGDTAAAAEVYPRERGGTVCTLRGGLRSRGLSPRARGNRRARASHLRPCGSIPASAGEPRRRRRAPSLRRVYPRERGGTVEPVDGAPDAMGLSPRARGNRLHVARRVEVEGSIPASAGEPTPSASAALRLRVYPRERGGTLRGVIPIRIFEGLSPRARGNHGHRRVVDAYLGSIPASAGEPTESRRAPSTPGVYPRERGGTSC